MILPLPKRARNFKLTKNSKSFWLINFNPDHENMARRERQYKILPISLKAFEMLKNLKRMKRSISMKWQHFFNRGKELYEA